MKRYLLPVLWMVLVVTVCAETVPELILWDFTKGLHGWTPGNFQSHSLSEKGFEGVSKYDCMLTSPKLNIQASDYDEAIVTVRTSIAGPSDMFIASNGRGFSDERKVRVYLPATASDHILRFHLSGKTS